ncbi:MAG: HIT domain-containing protein [Actinobacteria bacterium]|nr:MAG: HIT domain-containing protein [Actinomycetota bacterium]
MSDTCLFCRIAAGEIPATVVHETGTTLAFRDIGPKAPVHVLVIPKAHHANVGELAEADPALAGAVLAAAGAVAKAEGLTGDGYRIIFNTGPHSGQEVDHAHAHVLGGAPLGPMLCQ